ncbi:MAG: hypothetical protein M3P08_09520 [Thermoproteota archaeon]|nr:hypothetical protein [Thermoproteota archaeon]
MIFEDITKSLFPSDLFAQPGVNKPVVSDDLSDTMISLYRSSGIFASEGPVRKTTERLKTFAKDDIPNARFLY